MFNVRPITIGIGLLQSYVQWERDGNVHSKFLASQQLYAPWGALRRDDTVTKGKESIY